MNCFKDKESVEKFLKRTKTYDGRVALILRSYLKKGASVVNIGINNGKDYEVLSQNYDTIAVDSSEDFINIYKDINRSAEVYKVDDVKLNLNAKYDCIFSNKYLNHLTLEELRESFKNQVEILNDGGKIFHFFGEGVGELHLSGVKLNLYNEDDLRSVLPDSLEIVKVSKYFLDNRFSYVVIKKK
ncbi:MAG: methyltransferase domain-containing protein [Sarcina sp.]